MKRCDGKVCPYCHGVMLVGTKTAPTRDHVRPRRAGGTLVGWNCLVACQACNNDKGDRLLREFLEWLEARQDPRAALIAQLLARGIDRFDRVYGEDAVRARQLREAAGQARPS